MKQWISTNMNTLWKVAAIATLVLSGFLFVQWKNEAVRSSELNAELKKLKAEQEATEGNLDTLTERYNQLYSEKEGTAQEKLETSLEALFGTVYIYDTSVEEESLVNRREKALNYITQDALFTLFPEDVSGIQTSIQSVSTLDSVDVYIKPSDSNQQSGLVFVTFSASVSGSEPISGTVVYQFSFDQFTNKVTALTTIGQLPKIE